MADPNSTAKTTSLMDRLFKAISTVCGGVLRLLRCPVPLALLATIIGAIVFWMKLEKSVSRSYVDEPKQWALDYAVTLTPGLMTKINWESFAKHWLLAVKCFLPALILGLIRLRGIHRLLPITGACATVGLYWYVREMWLGWPESQQTRMGEIPAPEAFLVHLWLILGLILSIPALFLLYHLANTMDRYLVRSFLVPLLLCVIGMVGIMITTDLLNNANEFSKAGLDSTEVTIFYIKQIPQYLTQVLDVAVLLAVLFTLTRMSRFNEIISMMGSGRSLIRVAMPLLLLGIWLSYVGLCMSYIWGPSAQNAREQMLAQAEEGTQTSRNRDSVESKTATYNVVYRNRDQFRTWYVAKIPGSLQIREKMGLTVMIEDNNDGEFIRAWYAKRSSWLADQRHWRLFEGWMVEFHANQSTDPVPFEKHTFTDFPESPWTLASGKITAEFLTVPELISYLRTNKGIASARLSRYETTLWARYAIPLRTFLLTLVGVAFGLVMGRRDLLAGVSWAVGIFVFAFIAQIILQKTAEAGKLPTWVGGWAVNAAVFLIALVMLAQKNYNRSLMNWWTRLQNLRKVKEIRRARGNA